MTQLLHLRLGRFFAAVSEQAGAPTAVVPPWRHALAQPTGMAATLEMTARLDELAHRACRAVEWRSATEAWLDLGTGRGSHSPWAIADHLHAATKALLPVEVACGVAATKAAARAASALAAPSGLLVVLPGYEASILTLAERTCAAPGDRFDDPLDHAPFRPALVPRAIVRSAPLERRADGDRRAPFDVAARADATLDALLGEARAGLAELGVLASTMRVQFSGAAGVTEAFTALPDPTALEDSLRAAARPLARRALLGSAGSGHLQLSLGQLIAGPAQASLFGWRYDRLQANRRCRHA